jgi:hypothetical protein
MPALNRIYRSRHRRGVLPDNEEGKKAIEYLATTMRTARYSVATRLDRLNEHAPWLNDSQIEMLLYSGHGIVTNAKGKCRPLPDIISGSYLGQHLEVENEERERLKAWWIKPCDMSDEEFEAYKCEKRRKRESNRRRKNGAKSHADSDSRTKPWIDAGFKSRRTPKFVPLNLSAATRLRRDGKADIMVVQRLLRHEDIQTTAKYTHVVGDDVRAAMETETKSRQEVPQNVPQVIVKKA